MSKMLTVKTPDQMVAEEAAVIPKIIDLLSELSSAQQKRVVDYVASVVEQWRGPWSKAPNPEAPTVAPPAMPELPTFPVVPSTPDFGNMGVFAYGAPPLQGSFRSESLCLGSDGVTRDSSVNPFEPVRQRPPWEVASDEPEIEVDGKPHK